jgi:hypothetical protein
MSEETISGDEIDRVFDSGYRQGAENERQRIIARLTAYKHDLMNDANSAAESGGDPAWDIERAEAVETCVALIKGENE